MNATAAVVVAKALWFGTMLFINGISFSESRLREIDAIVYRDHPNGFGGCGNTRLVVGAWAEMFALARAIDQVHGNMARLDIEVLSTDAPNVWVGRMFVSAHFALSVDVLGEITEMGVAKSDWLDKIGCNNGMFQKPMVRASSQEEVRAIAEAVGHAPRVPEYCVPPECRRGGIDLQDIRDGKVPCRPGEVFTSPDGMEVLACNAAA